MPILPHWCKSVNVVQKARISTLVFLIPLNHANPYNLQTYPNQCKPKISDANQIFKLNQIKSLHVFQKFFRFAIVCYVCNSLLGLQ